MFQREREREKPYMVVPNFVIVVDNSSPEAPSGVYTSTSDGYGSQVNHENSKPNW